MSSNETAKLSKEQVDTFSALWSELDVHATNMLSVHELKLFVARLPHPMGLHRGMNVPTDGDVSGFLRTLRV